MTRISRRAKAVVVVVAVCTLIGCDESTAPPGPAASVAITPQSLIVYRDATAQLTAVVLDANAREVPGESIAWSSADSTIVTIAPSGVVTGARKGSALVYAAAAGHRDSALVAVLLPVGAIEVASTRLTLVPGAALPVSVTLETVSGPVDATDYISEWISRDPTVAAVEFGGWVTATGVGTTYIVARGGTAVDSVEVRVRLVNFHSVVPSPGFFTCGLSTDSAAFCWGWGMAGTLGTGTLDTVAYVPVGVAGGHRFASLEVGNGVGCALTGAGRAYCWGNNEWGQLGVGVQFGFAREPVAVHGGHTFAAIGVGYNNACGLDRDGQAWCWGLNDTALTTEPTIVGGNVRLASLSVGGFHSCGLTVDSVAYCWGIGSYGAVGDSTAMNRLTPTPVAGNLRFASVTAGPWSTCALTRTGVAYCWGQNDYGELGDSSRVQRNVPVPVAGGLTFTSVAIGVYAACGVSSTSSAYCWGINISGQAGSGDVTQFFTTPHAVAGGHSFAQVRTGEAHACGITTPPAVAYCWGYSNRGQLGDSSETSTLVRTPSRVAGQP